MSVQRQAHSFITSSFLDFLCLVFLSTLFWFLSFFSIQLAHFPPCVSMMKCSYLYCLYFFFFISKIHTYLLCWYRMSFIVVLHDINVCITLLGFAQHNTIGYIIKRLVEIGWFDWLIRIQSSACNQHNSQLRTCKIQSSELCWLQLELRTSDLLP